MKIEKICGESFNEMRSKYPGMTTGDLQSVATFTQILKDNCKNNKFTFFWLDGEREVLEGITHIDAINKSGYSKIAMSALDFYSEGDDDSYIWDNGWTKK